MSHLRLEAGLPIEDEPQVRELIGSFSVRDYASNREVRKEVDRHLLNLRNEPDAQEKTQEQTVQEEEYTSSAQAIDTTQDKAEGVDQASGREEEAEAPIRRTLETNEKILGPEHPDTATILTNLAELYQEQRREEEAELLLRQALEIRQRGSQG